MLALSYAKKLLKSGGQTQAADTLIKCHLNYLSIVR